MRARIWGRVLPGLGGLRGLASLAGQQVARSNAANAAAVLMEQRKERELVDAYLEQLVDAPARARA
jgi:hypothetical protein